MAARQLLRSLILGLLASLPFSNSLNAVSIGALFSGDSDLELLFTGKYRPEMFWGDNISLLNKNNTVGNRPIDRIFYARHILDLSIDTLYGRKKYEKPVLEFLFSLRNKAIWGNPESIASTTDAEIKFLDALVGAHRHAIPRHIFWMREAWMRFNLSTPVLGLSITNDHALTLGLFSFQLGRGIALGDAYAVGPELLGFYTETVVDQYTPGMKLSGEILKNKLSYDFYIGILQNKSATLGETGAKIYGQEFGRLNCPARGFGRINYVVAGRLLWYAFNNEDWGSFTFEPYGLFHEEPEQRIQFLGDASSKLGTIGLAGEYMGSKWEFGFDYAFNLGRQHVKGWDRNRVELQNRNGKATLVYSDVYVNASPSCVDAPSNLDAYKVVFTPNNTVDSAGALSTVGKSAQAVVDSAPQDAMYNGQLIGSVPGYTAAVGDVPLPVQPEVSLDQFYNAARRFRNPYVNEYEGWMFVADAAWWIRPKQLKVALTGGVASGDENPNNVHKNGEYSGFIGIQEIYSGKRVKSFFTLGGAGKLKRPLSVPDTEEAPSKFASEVNGFTNLVFTGASLTWTPTSWPKKFTFNPNILAYWQQFATRKFDIKTQKNLPQDARTYLGLEINTFMKYNLLPDLAIFFVGSVFVPGGHYCDIRGKPLNADQSRALGRYNDTGVRGAIPNIGTDTAVTLNLGFEYTF